MERQRGVKNVRPMAGSPVAPVGGDDIYFTIGLFTRFMKKFRLGRTKESNP